MYSHTQDQSIVRIPQWNAAEDGIRQLLSQNEYAQPTVVVRHFKGERSDRVLDTGTDRKLESRIWNHEYDDRDTASNRPKDPRDITYAWTIDLESNPLAVVRWTSEPMIFHPVQFWTEGLAVYDAARLTRKSECAYYFQGDRREALIGVVLASTTASSEGRAQKFFRETASKVLAPYQHLRDMQRQRVLQRSATYVEMP